MDGREALSCWYELYLNGARLPLEAKKLIESISVTESACGCSSARVVVNDMDFAFIDEDIFARDVPVRIEGGWDGGAHMFAFEGYVAAVDADFGERGHPVLSLCLMDATYLMSLEEKTRTWQNATSAEAVASIAAEYGFAAGFAPKGYAFAREECISQSNMTDIAFIRQLADRESDVFAVHLRGGTLFYGIREAAEPVADLWYARGTTDIISFSPRISRATVRERVAVCDIDPQSKRGTGFAADARAAARQVAGEPVAVTRSRTGAIAGMFLHEQAVQSDA